MMFDKSMIEQGVSVLYVEDEADARDIMADILELYVEKVYVATNGEEGLQAYESFLPDIIITDIQMPVMTGLDMVREIRKRDEDIPIVVISAFNDSDYLLESIKLGVDHYLLKPIVIDQLESRLKKIKKMIMQRRELDAYQLYLEDRVEEERALRETKEAMLISQNKDVELGQMVSIIAHQWKQPLHYLHLLIEDLGYEYQSGLTQEFVDDFIKKGVQRVTFLSETMDNFLRFYKSDHRNIDFTVSSVIEEVRFFLSSLFQALGISIVIEVMNDFSLKGSKNEFQQVILNLLNNAKEAFEGQKKADAQIVITIDVVDYQPTIKVCDNAGGVSETVIDKIFEMEYTTKASGNGIGLYLVKKVVEERFMGDISVENQEAGACFSLTFD